VALLKNQEFYCGDSVITDQYVLTAAHCVKDVSPGALTVVHGSNYWPNGTFAEVSEVIPHENYGNFKNDVALLKLATPLVFDEYTQAVPLHEGPVPTGATVFISGFGRTDYNSYPSEQLKYNEMTALSQEECGSKTGVHFDGLICFNGPQGNGACLGDSGGPALYNGELVGVASFIVTSCGTTKPDGYVKVSYFLDWIHEHTKKPVLKVF
jgi:trypsin